VTPRQGAALLRELQPEALLDSIGEGAYLVDVDRTIVFWNQSAERITGFGRAEVVGRHCQENLLRHVSLDGRPLCETECPLSAALADGQPRESRVFLHHKTGHRVPVDVRIGVLRDGASRVVGALEVFSDASNQAALEDQVEQLSQLAFLDALTQLPNRRFVEVRLESACNELNRYGWTFGLLFVDVDHFKLINDVYGHEAGDDMLCMVARTLSAGLRPSDVLARWGGEEFLAVIRNAEGGALEACAERCRSLVEHSGLRRGPGVPPVVVTVSVGGTVARPGELPADMVSRADAAMYRSKNEGRNRVTIH